MAVAAEPAQPRKPDTFGKSWEAFMADGEGSASYVGYPKGKPFLNSELQRSPEKPVIPYPESNSRDLLSQLSDAESRCALLEKQLEYMRNLVRKAESDRTSVLEKQLTIQGNKHLETHHLELKLKKLDKLENEYTNLTTMQAVAEKKIQEIEKKLSEEQHQRMLMQEKAAQLAIGLEDNRKLLRSATQSSSRTTKTKKKKNKHSEKKPAHSSLSNGQTHYRLNLSDVPFVAGKSTSPSHSVRANVQHVLHLMKQHNKSLCNEHVVNELPLATQQSSIHRTGSGKSAPPPTVAHSYQDLEELLITLQDEFGEMSLEHQDLLKQIKEARTSRLREDLGRELDSLVKRMEAKGDQITKVKRHQARLEKFKRELKTKSVSHYDERTKDTRTLHGTSEVRVTTTVTTKGMDSRRLKLKPGDMGKKTLQLLRDMQTLQTSLQKDDISWDY